MQNKEPYRKQSLLQKVKNEKRSVAMSNQKFIPDSFEELKQLQYRRQALSFMNAVIENKVKTKVEFCKENHISHHTLNSALEQLGMHKKKIRRQPKSQTGNGSERNNRARSGSKKKQEIHAGTDLENIETNDINEEFLNTHRPKELNELLPQAGSPTLKKMMANKNNSTG